MSYTSLVFGDIFECRDKEYIFLAKSEHAIYAATILNPVLTQRLTSLADKRVSQNKDVSDSHILYCYVVLTTDQYLDRAAHIGPGSGNYVEYKKLGIAIDLVDQKAILKEIKSTKAVSIELKELCSSLELD